LFYIHSFKTNQPPYIVIQSGAFKLDEILVLWEFPDLGM